MDKKIWFVLVFDLESKNPYQRVKIHREMDAVNLLKFQDSVYALPMSHDNQVIMEGIARQLKKLGAKVLLFRAELHDIPGYEEMEADLDTAYGGNLDDEYSKLLERTKELNRKIAKNKTPAQKSLAIRSLTLIQKKFEDFVKNDKRDVVSTMRGKLELEIAEVRDKIVKIK